MRSLLPLTKHITTPLARAGAAWRDAGSQIIAYNFVKRGIACLGYDPIGQGERRMLPDLEGNGAGHVINGTERYSPAFEHEYLQRQSLLNGANAASAWAWDLTILTDYLEHLPHIDGKRLGVAGCSGGGVQTAYLGAIDDRMVAVSIACYTSTLAVDFAPSSGVPGIKIGGGGPAEGEQQWGPFVGGNTLLDKPDLVQVRAPRPTQVLLTDRDQYFPLQGGMAAVHESMPAFVALASAGDAPQLTCTVGNNTHGYINATRLALYMFMSLHLNRGNDSQVEYQPDTIYDFEDLRVTSTGSVLTAPEINNGSGSRTLHDVFVLPGTANNLASLAKRREGTTFVGQVRATVADVVGYNKQEGPNPPSGTALPRQTGLNYSRYTIPGEGRCKIGIEVRTNTSVDGAPTAAPPTPQSCMYLGKGSRSTILARAS